MIARLAQGERSIGELATPFAMTFAGASKHVKVLEQAGIVRRRRAGRLHYCSLEPRRLADADAWLRHYTQFWTERLVALDDLLGAGDGGADSTNKDEPR